MVLFYIWACATVRRFRVWVLGKWEGRRKGKGGGNEMRDGRKRGGKLGGDAAETRVVFMVSDVFGSWGRGWRSRYYGMSKRV